MYNANFEVTNQGNGNKGDTTMNNQNAEAKMTAVTNNEYQAEAAKRQALVPEEEREVTYTFNKDGLKVLTNITAPERYMPDDEKLLPSSVISEEYNGARKIGMLSEIRGMGQISGALDNSIYAARVTNDRGNKGVVFCQQYDESDFTPKLFIEQANLFSLVEVGFEPERAQDKIRKRELSRTLYELGRQYMNAVSYECMFDIRNILALLFASFGLLPHCKETREDEVGSFYNMIKDTVSSYCCLAHKSYFALDDNQVAEVAREHHMTKKQLIRKLDYYGLLYHQESNAGYQAKIRFNGVPMWLYCIFNLEYFDTAIQDPEIIESDEAAKKLFVEVTSKRKRADEAKPEGEKEPESKSVAGSSNPAV